MAIERAQVVRAALEILDEHGLDGLTMRAVARRLGVQQNTVYWHVESKQTLLEEMADAIVAGVLDAPLPDDWVDRVRLLAGRYRDALLAHRDGARVVTGTFVTPGAGDQRSHSSRIGETWTGMLLGAGFAEHEAIWGGWSVAYFVLGLVQEEQAAVEQGLDLAEADRPDTTTVYPRVPAGDGFAARFAFGLELLVDGLRTRLAATTSAPGSSDAEADAGPTPPGAGPTTS